MRPLIHVNKDEPQAPAKAPAKPSKSKEAVKTLKLALAIGGLVIGGALIAWNFGLFGEEGPPPAPPLPAGYGDIVPAAPGANQIPTEGAK